MTERGSVQEFTRPQLANIASIMLTETIREFHGSIPHAAAKTTLNCLHSKLYSPTQLGEALIDDTDRLKWVAASLKINNTDTTDIRDKAKRIFDLAQQMTDLTGNELKEFLNKPVTEEDATLNDDVSHLVRRHHVRGLIQDAARDIASRDKIA